MRFPFIQSKRDTQILSPLIDKEEVNPSDCDQTQKKEKDGVIQRSNSF